MAIPEDLQNCIKEVDGYIFAVMNFATAISDDHFAVRDPLQFMGRDIVEHWEKIRDYLQRQQLKPSLCSVSEIDRK